jgi:hypothetical protein
MENDLPRRGFNGERLSEKRLIENDLPRRGFNGK